MRKKIVLKTDRYSYTIEEAYEKFLIHCEAKNLAKGTIKYYKDNYRYLLKIVRPDDLVISLDYEKIEKFVFLQKEQGIGDNAINATLRAFRTFINFCADRNYAEKFKVSLLKTNEELKETYTNEELYKLTRRPSMNDSFSTWRNWAAVNFLIGTGCRVNSIINVKVKDINLETNQVLLRVTKARKQQVIPLSQTLHKVLQRYLSLWAYEADDYLFPNACGEQMNDSAFKHEIAKYNIKRKVTKTSCHLFRHTFATNWIKNGGDMFRLQKILGHSTIDMVKRYVQLVDRDLDKNFDTFNALENIDGKIDII